MRQHHSQHCLLSVGVSISQAIQVLTNIFPNIFIQCLGSISNFDADTHWIKWVLNISLRFADFFSNKAEMSNYFSFFFAYSYSYAKTL